MINRVYKISNGLTMVESTPYHWQKESIYYGQAEPYHYYMMVNPMGFNDKTALSCSYTEENGILSINGEIKMDVSSIEEAGLMVEKMIKGMGMDVKGTIYEPTLENTKVEWIDLV